MKHIVFFLFIFCYTSSNAQVSDFKHIDFTIADNIVKLNAGSNLDNLPLLAHNLTYKLPTQVEKFRAVYTWVCNNVKGDINQHDKVDRKRKKLQNDNIAYLKWNNEFKKTAFKKLLKHKKTMCTGYAYLIKELCFLANIECEIVDGYGRTATSNVETLEFINHSWNAVKLNDKWYLCDATWSSGYTDSNQTFVQDYNDGYFLTQPVLFAKSHFPIQKKWLLNSSLTASQFVASPLLYGEAFEQNITPISPKEMNVTTKTDNEISFSFKTLEPTTHTNISLVQFIGSNEHPFKIYNIKNENGVTTFNYIFKQKGHYDIHLKVNDAVVATYTIQVTKS